MIDTIQEAKRIPKYSSVGFRLPEHLYKEAKVSHGYVLGYTIVDEVRDWLKENGLTNNRKNYDDIRDFFAASKFTMFLDVESCPDMDGYEVEYYSIAFTYPEHAMGFKLRWV